MAAILLFLTVLTVSGKNCFILASVSNCTYNFEFQNVNDDVTCHKYTETKSQGLRQHIQLLEERLGKLKSTQSSDDNGQCKEKKEYAISYTDYSRVSGIAQVEIASNPVKVYCNFESGGIVIIQRIKLDVSFNRTWKEYKRGFGEMGKGKDFWLGLDNIYKLTNQQDKKYKLLITIATHTNELKLYTVYDEFKVNSERESYKLEYGSYFSAGGGRMRPEYLSRWDEFQTWDHGSHTKSLTRGNCANYTAAVGGGGWWFAGTPYCGSRGKTQNCNVDTCGSSNLNARVPFWKYLDIRSVRMELQDSKQFFV